MHCPTCGKDSQNMRVCGHCQTPYPAGMQSKRNSASVRRVTHRGGSVLDKVKDLALTAPPLVRWGFIGVVVLVAVGAFFKGRDRDIPVGVAMPNIIAASMTLEAAQALLKSVEGTARVEARETSVDVRLSGDMPEQREGRLAFAQQYARADELVAGKKRSISFMAPDGTPFAKADPQLGVMLLR